MSFVPSLLQAIVQLDGEAVVLHVGEKPYVVTPTGQVDLATRGLTFEAVSGILNQLLPIESRNSLEEFGAAQYELPPSAEMPLENFTIVAAASGDDIWLEIRRRRARQDHRVPLELFDQTADTPAVAPIRPAVSGRPAPGGDDALEIPDVAQLFPGSSAQASEPEETWEDVALPTAASVPPQPETRAPLPAPPISVAPAPVPPAFPKPIAAAPQPPPPAPPIAPPAPKPPAPAAGVKPTAPAAPAPTAAPKPVAPAAAAPPPSRPAPAPAPSVFAPPAATMAPAPPPRPPAMPGGSFVHPQAPAPVLPLSRNPIRADVPPPLAEPPLSSLDHLLRLAAARGASMLYLSSEAHPAVRVDGSVQTLDGTPILRANEVEALLLTLMPERSAEALRTGVASEWIVDVPEVGRVRCTSFRDHRGPGGVFRMLPSRAVSADQLGLSREVQMLAIEPEGLVLVAGPRSSGKRTLISAIVDLINRSRRDHVITIESEINVVHERGGSLISQRAVRGSDEVLAMAQAALHEDPDILVLEEVRSAALMTLALDAASSGQLIVGGLPAHNAAGAIDRIIDLYPPEYRRQVQLSLAQNLRGVVAQVLLPRTGGGRVAAREVLLNTPAVRSVLAEGKTSQLPLVIEGGRVHGMLPLNDALIGYVQNGIVDVREAYRHAPDRSTFLALLKRYGIDTSPLERYA